MESYIGSNALGTTTGVRRGREVVDVIGELNKRRVVRPTNDGFEYGNYDDDDVDWDDADTLRKSSQFKEDRRIASARLAENKRLEIAAEKVSKARAKRALFEAGRKKLASAVGPIDRYMKRGREDFEDYEDYNPEDGSHSSSSRKKVAVRNIRTVIAVPDLLAKRSRDVASDGNVAKVSKPMGPFSRDVGNGPARKLHVCHSDFLADIRKKSASNFTNAPEPYELSRKAEIRRIFTTRFIRGIAKHNRANGGAALLIQRERAGAAHLKWLKRYADPFRLLNIRSDYVGTEKEQAIIYMAVKNLIGKGIYDKQYANAICSGLAYAMREYDAKNRFHPVFEIMRLAIKGAYTTEGALRPMHDPMNIV